MPDIYSRYQYCRYDWQYTDIADNVRYWLWYQEPTANVDTDIGISNLARNRLEEIIVEWLSPDFAEAVI